MSLMMQPAARTGRKLRSPKHSWQVRQKPFLIQPVMIAPVLPGETLKKLVFQARVVTDPIKNPLIGWWKEYYFFYVKLRDLEERDKFTAMVVQPDWDPVAQGVTTNTAAVEKYFGGGTGVNWVEKCLKAVTINYFRDEGEAYLDATTGADGLPMASINQDSWLNSATPVSLYKQDDQTIVVGSDDSITASEIDEAMWRWELMKLNNMTNMTFEDYLQSFGLSRKKEDDHVPELVRYVRDWQYPSNTVDPTTGTPSSAVSWAISERADKDRFIREPGFIFGVTITRPKVYLSKQTSAAVRFMDDAFSWLPAAMRGDPTSSFQPLGAVANTPVPTAAESFWVDVADLLVYGDQFINFALTETDAGLVGLPTTTLQRRFVSGADIDALWKGTARRVREDGMAQLHILGAQQDHTPRGKVISLA